MEKKKKTDSIFLRVDKELKQKLFNYSNKSGIPVSTFIRRAVSNKLKRIK